MREFWTFFAFPLNLLLLILWIGGLWIMWSAYSKLNRATGENHRSIVYAFVSFMLSPAATISSLVLLIGSCLWLGISGNREFVQSIFFVLVLIYTESVVLLVLLRGWRRRTGRVRWRFLLIHLGLLIAVGAGLLASADSWEARVKLHKGQITREVYLENGGRRILSYELQLIDFHTEIAQDGLPSHYEARIGIGQSTDDAITYHDLRSEYLITVNHPLSPRFGENIYLSSVSSDYCVLQIVRDPWRYMTLAGIIMLLAGAFMLFVGGPRKDRLVIRPKFSTNHKNDEL